ncbi:diacylglycerol/lipid kinase family protein [Cryobacterium tepidiphilum]|uniref:Diacylglycerol kinase n=1 Tax=Cryobacterium tepidiphilum TaxID=2486026 RepID=A0A3M8LLS5_9MICO|nr:diacylglycerol kinase family protein [Cryobacterium tepidiphilum]RNE66477.1 diacylglycerol kinase [Cryobacterium tepidiphilum]
MTEPRKPAPATRFAAVVYNPTKVDRETLEPVVATEQAEAGWGETQWYETTAEDPGQGATTQAVDAGASMVIVAGGDGTVRAVAEQLQGSGLPLALVPSGTGNLLARNMDLTLDDLGHSIHTAFSGQDRAIDLGMIDLRHGDGTKSRHAYLVMAGLGLDAKMLANTDEELKKKFGWIAYVGAIVKALRDKNRLRMRMKLDDGRVRSVWAHTIIVGNCGSLQANVLLLPDAAVDDGLLDIIVLRPEGFVGWVQIVIKIVWENGVLRRSRLGRKMMMGEVRALNYSRGRSLTVSLRREEAVELDGDGFGDCVALTTWVVPGALTVRVP